MFNIHKHISHLIFVLVPECAITNFILDEIKRSISISVYYGWKRSMQNGRWREIDLKIIIWLQISYSPHSGMKSLSFRENIWNLTKNVYLMSIFSITTSRYQRHFIVWCLIYINTFSFNFCVNTSDTMHNQVGSKSPPKFIQRQNCS
jgi:hypothetical protein